MKQISHLTFCMPKTYFKSFRDVEPRWTFKGKSSTTNMAWLAQWNASTGTSVERFRRQALRWPQPCSNGSGSIRWPSKFSPWVDEYHQSWMVDLQNCPRSLRCGILTNRCLCRGDRYTQSQGSWLCNSCAKTDKTCTCHPCPDHIQTPMKSLLC